MQKKMIVVRKEIRKTLEYQTAMVLFKSKKEIRERLNFINFEIREIRRISREAVTLAKKDIDSNIDLVLSPLSQLVAVDDKLVKVKIYPDGLGFWMLEFWDDENNSSVWNTVFHTDRAALDKALEIIEATGIGALFVSYDSSRRLL